MLSTAHAWAAHAVDGWLILAQWWVFFHVENHYHIHNPYLPHNNFIDFLCLTDFR
jgi:hypothetical protein